MEKAKYVIDDFSFHSRSEYERAQKEKETIAYLIANTDMTDLKAVLKIYNRSIEKKSFQTVIGLTFIQNIRKKLIAGGIGSEETIAKIPVTVKKSLKGGNSSLTASDSSGQVEKYKAAYELANANGKIKNIAIAVLLFVVIGMLLLSYKSKYSVFTYFTDYKEQMREELIDEYESWEQQLNEREQDLEARESKQR